MIGGVNMVKHLTRQEKYREVIGGVNPVKHLTRQEKHRETGKRSLDKHHETPKNLNKRRETPNRA